MRIQSFQYNMNLCLKFLEAFVHNNHNILCMNITPNGSFFFVRLYQARFFFQQLMSGVSYCHSMVKC
jgi:serine/threonine protein kinase